MKLPSTNEQEKEFLIQLGRGIFERLTKEFEDFCGVKLDGERKELLSRELQLLEREYFDGLDKTYFMAKEAFEKGRQNKARARANNPKMNETLAAFQSTWLSSAGVPLLGGMIFSKHIAGIKYLHGLDEHEGALVDVFTSATSLSLGAHNPYATIYDYFETALKMRDNFSVPYHPGMRHAFFVDRISKLYPSTAKVPVNVHSEASGTVADSVSIEAALAYVEKRTNSISARMLAVDGTWAGTFSAAREGTGFGVSDFSMNRTNNQPLYVERCLPAPTTENKERFLNVVQDRVERGLAAGLYIEPDVIGDLGVPLVCPEVLRGALAICRKHQLPIIADCVQQIGRTGSYWGENVDKVLKDYPLLIVTAAKSASNGQFLGYTLIPKEIASKAYPLCHINTNHMNGALLRAVAVSEFLCDANFQSWLAAKGKKIEEVAKKHGIAIGERGLRGKYMNRGVFLETNDNVKLAQIALLVEDGLLTGSLPETLRYQPMLMDYSSTNELIAEIIFRRVGEVMQGKVSQPVKEIFDKLQGVDSGLAMKNM